MKLLQGSLRHPQVTLVVTGMLLVAGVLALLRMPRREDPKITIRTGLVIAAYPGATPEQVEEQVAKKIEERLFRFAEVKKAKTFSTSRPGLVIVNVALQDWVAQPDEFWSKLRLDLNDLGATALPSGVRGPIVSSDFGDTIAMLIAVHGARYDYRELVDFLARIEDQIRTIPSVSKLKRYGEQREQIYVTSTLERLAQYGVPPLQVIQSLQAQNVVQEAGAFETARGEVRLHTTHLFQDVDQIREQIVGVSPAGQAIRLGDLATVERRYEEPRSLVRVDGRPAVFLSVEMQEGYNIVDFGQEVERTLATVGRLLPPDVVIAVIADQPKIVDESISDFVREFLLAIGAVILVTVLLLPLQVAAIAAVAIPVTVSVTFAVMNALGIELHQVSLAGLIVSLGIVVDDAIVIADNYVELLDHGLSREEAAYRSAADLAVPVLAATLTIIASFFPMAFLSGSTGEFIRALPVTVSVALLSSYVVAMLLTPILCRLFITRGIRAPANAASPGTRRRWRLPSPLALMQSGYEWAAVRGMRHKAVAIGIGIVAVLASGGLYRLVTQRFFPGAERDQFAINVWLPEGTRLEATDGVTRGIEAAVRRRAEVRSVAAFVGTSAPRFYYNFDPEPNAANFAQLLVNTGSNEATVAVARVLRAELPPLVPEAQIWVKEMEQGPASKAPLEVRISGPDITGLKRLGDEVAGILRTTPGTAFVQRDFREDSYSLTVAVNSDVANRVGLTNTGIARTLAGSFLGTAVSTFWEGDHAVDILLRLDESRRESFDNIAAAYVTSERTGARVPLRAVATLRPAWQTSRLVRRNGVRTLTVRSNIQEGSLASAVLAKVRPRIAALELPSGYRVEYGGEIEQQEETFAEMRVALAMSLLAIFLILLFQFRVVREALIVMVSIPLALFGAMLGLVITSNPFGFTAFVGLIALTGVVVRNAIILIDYVKEQRRHGAAVERAAMDAGRRRLRPIFLTTMAAAVGVTPLILSGSDLWSPLASVIAVGLLFSMIFTLLVVPVLYVVVEGYVIREVT